MEMKDTEQAANNTGAEHVDTENEQQEAEPVDMDEDAAAKERLTADDPSKVKFTTVNLDGYAGKNGDAKVDIQVVQTSVGMGKEELMKYANEPFWIRMRMFLFVLFWISWLAMLVGAVVIILLAPRCPPPPRLEWYQKTTIYQVHVKSFKDSDDDGKGDLQGLISKLDYFKTDLNVDTLMLSAFYSTAPNTEGIINHTAIDSTYGTLDDFENLLTKMKEKDMKLIIDFNPNHSSDKHSWFQSSIEEELPYKDFYVWANATMKNGERNPPNDWLSVDGGSAWEWNDRRQQYYLHTYGKNEPDLNLRNEDVKEQLKEILLFWLKKGIDGIKVSAASHLVDDVLLQDDQTVANRSNEDVDHSHNQSQLENLVLLNEWKEFLHNFSVPNELKKILLAEVSKRDQETMFESNSTNTLATFGISTQLMDLTEESTAYDLKEKIISSSKKTSLFWPNWMLGSKDVKRLASRVGPELMDGLHMVSLLSLGTPITYYGDELGMMDSTDSPVTKMNFAALTPMQWNNETNGGFTNASKPWLPLNPEYPTVNVQTELNSPQSHLKIFSKLVSLRDQPAIKFGLQEYPLVDEHIFSMIRVRKGAPGYLVVLNMGLNSTRVDFTGIKYLPEKAHVEVRSNNIVAGVLKETEKPKIGLEDIPLGPKQAVVFSFVPKFQ